MPTHTSSLQARPEGMRLSLWRRLRDYSHGVYPCHNFKDQLNRLKFIMRGLWSPQVTQAWFEILNHPVLAIVRRAHPHITSKIHRPYLHRDLQIQDRLVILRDHYEFLIQEFRPSAIREIYSSSGLCLTVWEVEGLGRMSLRLHYSDHIEKEGELALGIFDETRRGYAFRASFSAMKVSPDAAGIFIGGLQGSRKLANREWTVAITREMHGLRPKALLLFGVQCLAEHWGVQTIQAVADAGHIYQHWSRRKSIGASYDEFWQESGGNRVSSVAFSVPPRQVIRDICEIKPNKRTMYRRRYEQLDEFSDQIKQALNETSTRPGSALSRTPLEALSTHPASDALTSPGSVTKTVRSSR